MIEFMRDYCNKRFLWEEEYMKKYNYPHFLSHAREHRNCREYFSRVARNVQENGVGAGTVVDLNKNLVAWLLNHIRKTDLKMCEFLRPKFSE